MAEAWRRLALATLLAALQGCSAAAELVGAAAPELPQPEGITVLFNQREGSAYRSPVHGVMRSGDDLEQALLEAIAAAQHEILVAVQELSLPRLAEALVAQHRRGLQVRVVLENHYSSPWSQQHEAELDPHQRQRHQQLRALADRNGDGQLSAAEREQGDAVALLQRAGVPMLDDTADGSRGSGLMHSKYVVLDRSVVITGSANFTASGIHGDAGQQQTRGNVNHLLKLKSPALAELFAQDFALMWGDGPGGAADSRFGIRKAHGPAQSVTIGNAQVQVLFAPHRRNDPNHGLNLLEQELANTKQRVDMALFVFSAQQLSDRLAELLQRGVTLRLVADPGFASRAFSETLDLLGVSLADQHCKIERGNAPLATPTEGVGTPQLPRGDKMHHKFAVIDNRTVITGSFNWSPSAAHQNDEVLLVIRSPQLAAHFTREMDRLWKGADLGITSRLQRKLTRNRQRCGSGMQRV
ncbi:MAG: phospholipase D-like domain-containing protein [Vulcanococcus sp.]